MMTPDTMQKTRCIVGSIVGVDQDWDINLAETKSRTTFRAARELMAAAVTGISDNNSRLGYAMPG